eukprot:1161424-Pelagomonas_calceolata.AAC.9
MATKSAWKQRTSKQRHLKGAGCQVRGVSCKQVPDADSCHCLYPDARVQCSSHALVLAIIFAKNMFCGGEE